MKSLQLDLQRQINLCTRITICLATTLLGLVTRPVANVLPALMEYTVVLTTRWNLNERFATTEYIVALMIKLKANRM